MSAALDAIKLSSIGFLRNEQIYRAAAYSDLKENIADHLVNLCQPY